jgi:hypothetical protein
MLLLCAILLGGCSKEVPNDIRLRNTPQHELTIVARVSCRLWYDDRHFRWGVIAFRWDGGGNTGRLLPWDTVTVFSDGSYQRRLWTDWDDRSKQVVTTGKLATDVFSAFLQDVKHGRSMTAVDGIPTFVWGDTGGRSKPTPSGVQVLIDALGKGCGAQSLPVAPTYTPLSDAAAAKPAR